MINSDRSIKSSSFPLIPLSARTKASIAKITLIVGFALAASVLFFVVCLSGSQNRGNIDFALKVKSAALVCGMVLSIVGFTATLVTTAFDEDWLVDKFSDPPPCIPKGPSTYPNYDEL